VIEDDARGESLVEGGEGGGGEVRGESPWGGVGRRSTKRGHGERESRSKLQILIHEKHRSHCQSNLDPRPVVLGAPKPPQNIKI
jgi:hypothetical protein